MYHITVLLADDHKIVREGIRVILEMEKDIVVIGEAKDGRVAVALAKELRPAVVLMDIAMPLLNGFYATRQILKSRPGIKVLILSAYSDREYVRKAIEAGAMGFLDKQASMNEVCRAIREVQRGKLFLSSAAARRMSEGELLQLDQFGVPSRTAANALTSRELEVLQLIAEGKTNKESAAELGIGVKTVEKHGEHLMQKLNIHDTAGLTRYAITNGMVESIFHLQTKPKTRPLVRATG